ncbi:hypothetical protein [uncultured Muriicola sp.]|uniref:hypothetical protein n=1 Tax=uncultured Muriicola sp. TaxID=1583102 RepID=UPI0026252A40|nr:hypothetical protein [uncultured Muriicola sp.]
MQIRFTLVVVFLICIGCNRNAEKVAGDLESTTSEVKFDKTKWLTKEDSDYPYREQMLHDIVYNDSIRKLTKDELLVLLGKPDRSNEGHLYYMISQKKLGFWPIRTKTLVIKLTEENTIEWIKIHE